ncbi:MAG: F0F1 ATP synthase subunit A, partial [Acetobacteraceae bacterium]
MAAEGKAIDALSQFELTPFLGAVGESVRFSQSNAHMLLVFGLITALMLWGTAKRAIVPGRIQALAESGYEFVHGIVVGQVGDEGRKYFPFVFSIFMFVLFGNMLGLLPYAFTFTSHIAVTLALAVLVFLVVTIVALVI